MNEPSFNTWLLIVALLANAWSTFDGQAALPETPPNDAARQAMWHTVMDFEEPLVSRQQLLAEFASIVTNYPDSQYHQQAAEAVGILKRMIAEDAAHAKTAPTNPDLLPTGDRVRELIFQLRDQNGHQWSQPGWCDIFLDHRGTNSPASKLVAMGYAAVPQLIIALDDATFTRSVGYWRDFTYSHTVLTVGDCAAAILQRIAGRTFYEPGSTSGYMSNEHKDAATRQAVEAWWRQFQQEGEELTLIEGTETGDRNAPSQAEFLIDRYPKVALAPLIKGTKNSTDEWIRTRLVQLFEKFDSPAAVTFLEQEMNRGASSPSVVAAAILNRKGRREAITTMIREWERSWNTGPADMKGANELVRFLASVDSPEAITALGAKLQDCSLNTRMAVVETVGEGGSWWYNQSAKTNRSLATRDACEKLLVAALQDAGQEMGESGSRMGKSYIDPRVCDMAGFFLNQRWPERYNFDLSASLKIRDAQCLDCENHWRHAHNLPLLPLPPAPTVHVSKSSAAQITAIEWRTNMVKPSDSFLARVEAFRDHVLVETNVVNLLLAYATNPEPGTSGLTFQARKDEDLTGVKLSLCLLPGTPQNPQDDWSFAEDAVVGDKAIDCSAGGIWATERRSWETLARSINTAVGAAPETAFVINVKLVSKEH